MKVLVTGSNGFLGKIFCDRFKDFCELKTLSSQVGGDFVTDLSKNIIRLPYFDIVVHCAGKAHGNSLKYEDKNAYYNINTNGTLNLLNSLKDHPPKLFVYISSVSVYGLDSGHMVTEDYPLLGSSAYAKSKILAEQIVINQAESNNFNYLILRLPLVIGYNPKGNLRNMIQKLNRRLYFSINHSSAVKSMVLATDVADLILNFPSHSGIFNLTDGYHPSVRDLEILICKQYNIKTPINLSKNLARFLAHIGDIFPFFPLNSLVYKKIVSNLTFSDYKARMELNWNSNKVVDCYFVF